MGNFNSSVTRVWPVFDRLLAADATGESWLGELLRLGHLAAHSSTAIFGGHGRLLTSLSQYENDLPAPLVKVLGSQRAERLSKIRNAFERDIPPSDAFLRWMIEHPDRLVWPRDKGGRERKFGASTTEKRRRLMDGDSAARDEALSELARCAALGSRRKWWAFEGFTSVDCLLETEHLVVFIEGKRTEGISSATDWFPGRNQVIRNLEVARESAGPAREYAVLLCAEQPIDLPDEVWDASLPHFSPAQIYELRRHYLGCATWQAIRQRLCPDLILPDKLDDAVDLCVALRGASGTWREKAKIGPEGFEPPTKGL